MSTTASPMHPQSSTRHSVHSTVSPTPFAYNHNQNTYIDDSSDEDEGGVFFGAYQPAERLIVEQLSQQLSSPAQSPLASDSPILQRLSRNRVRKRDSREFLRRRTILLPRHENSSSPVRAVKEDKGKEKATISRWVGKAFETRFDLDPDDSDLSSPPSPYNNNDASPLKSPRDAQSDLTFDFSTFRLRDSPSPLVRRTLPRTVELNSDLEEEETEDDSSLAGDSDKESSGISVAFNDNSYTGNANLFADGVFHANIKMSDNSSESDVDGKPSL
jgi:hypothetical protein